MKNRLFHPLPASPMREARRALSDLNDELRRAGLPKIKGGRSLASVRAATEEARKEVAAEQERKQKEEEARQRAEEAKKRKAFEKYKNEIKRKIEEAKEKSNTKDKISVIMSVLSPEDQAALRAYDSDDIVGIAETYQESDDIDFDIFKSAEEYKEYQRQQQRAFQEEEESEEPSPFEDVPFA